jgi:hypothetical protein
VFASELTTRRRWRDDERHNQSSSPTQQTTSHLPISTPHRPYSSQAEIDRNSLDILHIVDPRPTRPRRHSHSVPSTPGGATVVQLPRGSLLCPRNTAQHTRPRNPTMSTPRCRARAPPHPRRRQSPSPSTTASLSSAANKPHGQQ